jgi:2-polyprenyl-3-methyl-5-hydroxy-6-metoxy-1,4-benzoquinol methylase
MERCPVCGGEAAAVLRLDAAHIAARLKDELGADVPADVAIADYAMRECSACGLVFADPMLAGDGAYYRWITGFPDYHAQDRWEWGVVRRLLAERGPARLLELGCGEGRFLASLSDLKNVTAEGIDLSAADVAAAQARGVKARCLSLEDAIEEDARFDMVFMSHVLEHVDAPLAIVEGCKRLLQPGGEIVFSVPYSPTSREYRVLDIMNLPPHHLTRWNMRALMRLAGIAGLDFAFEMRKPKSLAKRALRDTAETVTGKSQKTGTAAALALALTHPNAFAASWKRHAQRETVNGRRAADEILVRLKLP